MISLLDSAQSESKHRDRDDGARLSMRDPVDHEHICVAVRYGLRAIVIPEMNRNLSNRNGYFQVYC